jgi:hypothetical protein
VGSGEALLVVRLLSEADVGDDSWLGYGAASALTLPEIFFHPGRTGPIPRVLKILRSTFWILWKTSVSLALTHFPNPYLISTRV